MNEIYEEGLPETHTLIEYDNVVLSDAQEENVRVVPRDKWVDDITRLTGWSESDVERAALMSPPQLVDISARLYGEDIVSWEMLGTYKKLERFYTSHKGKDAKLRDMLSGHGTVVSEKVKIREEDNCGETEICIRLDKDVYNLFSPDRLYKAGETHCFIPSHVMVKDDDEWVGADDDRFMIAELPTSGDGMCLTDKSHLKYADEIEYKEVPNVKPGEQKWYRRGRDYPPYKDGIKMSKIMEEKELSKWFTKDELKRMGYPKKGAYTGSLP